MLSRWMHWCLAPRESQEDDEDAWDRKDGLKKKIIKILHNYVTVFFSIFDHAKFTELSYVRFSTLVINYLYFKLLYYG